MHVASSVSTQSDATAAAGASGRSTRTHGTSSVTVNGVTLDATYHMESEGLSVVIQGFDSADPVGTRLDERMLLNPNERRVIAVRRAHGQPPVHFSITRVGDGMRISADDA